MLFYFKRKQLGYRMFKKNARKQVFLPDVF